MLLTEGQVSDFQSAAMLLNAFLSSRELIAEKGYDGNGFRKALAEGNVAAFFPKNQPHDRHHA